MIDRIERACASVRHFVDQQSQAWSREAIRSELFHYTSPDGFIGIVANRNLWASDMLSLNDASEVTYPQRVIAEAVEESDSLPRRHRERFNTQLTEYMFRVDAPYVVCFCEDGDLLSQWRGYGASGEGFAVGFGIPWLLSLDKSGFRLQRVIYDRDEQRALVLSFLDRVAAVTSEEKFSDEEETQIWQRAAASLSSWVVMFKHPSFREEGEWRIVSEFERRPSCFKNLFRRSGRRIVPYVTIDIPHDMGMEGMNGTAITRVVRGPYFQGIDTRGPYFMLVARGFIMAGGSVEDSRIPLCN